MESYLKYKKTKKHSPMKMASSAFLLFFASVYFFPANSSSSTVPSAKSSILPSKAPSIVPSQPTTSVPSSSKPFTTKPTTLKPYVSSKPSAKPSPYRPTAKPTFSPSVEPTVSHICLSPTDDFSFYLYKGGP